MTLAEGRTVDYTESVRDLELAITSAADSTRAEVRSIPAALLDRLGPLEVPGSPMTLRIKRYLRNASWRCGRRPIPQPSPRQGSASR